MPEQRQLTEEDLKNMSPEEIQELQKQQCVFCQIISGKIPSKKVYEDDKVIALLDINPATAGHILLLPKEHYAIMPQVPDNELHYLFVIAKQLSHAILKGLQVEGTTTFIANGLAAGQKAPHFMIHLMPRSKDDGVGLELPEKPIQEEELKKLQAHIGKKVAEKLGVEPPHIEETPEKAPKTEEEESNENITTTQEKENNEDNISKQEEQIAEIEEETAEIEEPDINQIASMFAQEEPEDEIDHKNQLSDLFETESEEQKPYPGVVIGSKKSEKFHIPGCPFANKISKANKVLFNSKKEAMEHKKEPCDCVLGIEHGV